MSKVRLGVIKDLMPRRNKSDTFGAFDVKPEKTIHNFRYYSLSICDGEVEFGNKVKNAGCIP